MRNMPQNYRLESDEDGLKELNSPDHGGEIWKASMELGVVPNKLLDFSANVNPLGCSPLAKMALKRSLDLVSFYPDNECTELRRAIASYIRKILTLLISSWETEQQKLYIYSPEPS